MKTEISLTISQLTLLTAKPGMNVLQSTHGVLQVVYNALPQGKSCLSSIGKSCLSAIGKSCPSSIGKSK